MKKTVQAAAVPALLLLIVTLFYWKITLSKEYSWLDSPDFAYQVLPWYQFQAGEWHAGRFPLWIPFEWGGQSLIGQAQPGAAYPLNWLLFLLPLRNGWLQQVYLHWYFVAIHYLAALFAYWLCRDLKRSRGASLLGGLAFGIGGWMGSVEWPQMMNGALWLPVVALFLLRMLRGEREVRSAGLAGAALGMAFLSGHHQAPTFIALAAGGIWVYALALRRWRVLVPLAVFGMLLVLVSALQTFPAYEYGKLAVRWVGAVNDPVGWKDPVPYRVQGQFSLYPMSLVGVVVPTVMQHASAYIGLVVFALAFIGMAVRWREREVRVLLGIAVGGAIYSLSQFAVFHGVLYALVPLVEKARNASMAILLFHGGAAVLAAYGLDAVLERGAEAGVWSRRTGIALVGFAGFFAALLAGLTLTGSTKALEHEQVMMVPVIAAALAGLLAAARSGGISRRPLVGALVAVAVLEFGFGAANHGWGHRNNPHSMLRKLAADGDVAAYLQKQPGLARVELDMEAVPYNFGVWYGIDTFDEYDASMMAHVFHLQADTAARRLFGLNYLVGRKPTRNDQVEVMKGASGLKVYANPSAGPRVWSVHEVAQIGEGDVPFQWMRTQADLHARAFMTTAPPVLERCGTGDQVRLVRRQPNRVEIDAALECRGMVVASEVWAPGWEAAVDGRPVPIHRVYNAMRGVVVEAGSHRIEMRYRPRTVLAGAWCTALGWLLTALLAGSGKWPLVLRRRT
jgi:hypothetical protein